MKTKKNILLMAGLLFVAGLAFGQNQKAVDKVRRGQKIALSSFEYDNIDYSANLINLQNFHNRTSNGGPKKLFIWGDAGANPGAINAAICRGEVMALIEEYGIAGVYGSQVNLNPNMDYIPGGSLAEPRIVSGSPTLKLRVSTSPTNGWFGLWHRLNAVGDMIDFYRSGVTPTDWTRADKVGAHWVAQPLGGDFDILIDDAADGEGNYTLLQTVSGYSATKEHRSLELDVPSGRYRIAVSNSTDTVNHIIGPINYDSTSEGVLVMYSYVDGGTMSKCGPFTNEVRSFVEDMDPDLFIFNFGDLGQDDEATYRDNIATNMMPWIVAGIPDSVILLNGMNYQNDPTLADFDIEEEIIRDAAILNHWAYYDARRYAGSFTNTINKGWVGVDPVLLTNEGQLAYARPLFAEMGFIGPRHEEGIDVLNFAALRESAPGTSLPIYINSITVSNKVLGWPDGFIESGNMTVDRPVGEITVPNAGIYRVTYSVGSARDTGSALFVVAENGDWSTYKKALNFSPTQGFEYSQVLETHSNTVFSMYATDVTVNTYLTNSVFMVEQIYENP